MLMLSMLRDSSFSTVPTIRSLVEQAFTTGLVSVSIENQLRKLLQTTKYGGEDLQAFMMLQLAVMQGEIKQESRELLAEIASEA
jgi:hypothetical protein